MGIWVALACLCLYVRFGLGLFLTRLDLFGFPDHILDSMLGVLSNVCFVGESTPVIIDREARLTKPTSAILYVIGTT